MLRLSTLVFLLMPLAADAAAETSSRSGLEGKPDQPVRLAISATASRESESARRNIFAFDVVAGAELANEGPFFVLYYLDGRFVKEYRSESLPFRFRRNLRAHKPGMHVVRIDLEDDDDHLLATGSIFVRVEREPDQETRDEGKATSRNEAEREDGE